MAFKLFADTLVLFS